LAERAPESPLAAVASPPPEVAAPLVLFGSKTLHRMLAAFTYRDYRVQWFGACTSSIGTWTQLSAQNWMILTLTGSAFYLGLDTFLQQIPIVLFTLIGGVMADRYDRRRTLLASQYIQMATAATLALLVYADTVTITHILVLSFITGSAQAFGGPAYQALIPSLVDKKDLPNAVALNSIQFNIARVIGPLVFTTTLGAAGWLGINEQQAMGLCFMLNAASFLVVIYALMSLHVKHTPSTRTTGLAHELGIGLSYVRAQGTLSALIVLAAMTTFLGFAVLTFLPIFAQDVYGAGASTYGRLLAFSGAGSVVGALVVAWLGRFKRMGLTALLVQALYGLLIVGFALTDVMWVSGLLLFLLGAALMIVFATVTSLVQLLAPNEMRGRVMSIYLLAFRGGMPLGGLVSGYLATFLTASTVLIINGALLVAGALYFLARSHGVREA
jgi:MFS family permease